MRSLFTRAARDNKGHRLTPVAFIIFAVAAFIVISSAVGKAAFRYSPEADNISTGSLPPAILSPDTDVLQHANQGREGVDLAARLTQDGGLINRPISWKIFQRDQLSTLPARAVFNEKTPIVETNLKPGPYRIEIRYGHVTIARNIDILPNTRLGITFILNVGGLRSLSRVTGMDASEYSTASHKIFRLGNEKTLGKLPGKLIVDTIGQGEIVRLAAGQYRIESRFDNGNTLAIALVTIKPGILTSLNIDHQAALAKLAFLSSRAKPVKWLIHSHKGQWKKSGKNMNPAVILAPGRYTFSAQIGQKTFSRTVSLAKGKSTTIVLGN